MQYLKSTFTLPTAYKVSDKRWDYCFMDKDNFKKKYNINDEEYDKLKTELYD